MWSRLMAVTLSLVLMVSCTAPLEPTVSPAPEQSGEPARASAPVEETPPPNGWEEDDEEKDKASHDEDKQPAWTQWVFLSIPITREQAGLAAIPTHSMNGYTPNEFWLSVADGSRPFTDEHFSWSVRHGMEFPFMRFNQRDMVLFAQGFQGDVIAGICIGDAMSEVTDCLGEPTQRETYQLDRSEYDEFFYKGEEQPAEKTFFHYKGNGFYVSFMGDGNVEMIGLKRTPVHDYDPDLLKNWEETLTWRKDGAYLEYRESFFQSLNQNSWMGGTSVSNVGLSVSEYESAVAVVYNDFQGNLYLRVREDLYDPDEWEQMTFDSWDGNVRFVDRDSNFESFRRYMYEYALLEEMFARAESTSPNGKYRVVYESVRPYDYYLCFRSSDLATKDRLHTWMGGPVSHWLDDDYFLITDMHGRPTLYHVEIQGKIENTVMEKINDSFATMDKDSFDRDRQTFSVWGSEGDNPWVIRWSYRAGGELEMNMQ